MQSTIAIAARTYRPWPPILLQSVTVMHSLVQVACIPFCCHYQYWHSCRTKTMPEQDSVDQACQEHDPPPLSNVAPPQVEPPALHGLVIGALLSAASFGSQACFYSDSTVLAAQGSGCNLMSHALTQFPYAFLAAVLAFFGFLALA